jgi:signal transduction histidine kinase
MPDGAEGTGTFRRVLVVEDEPTDAAVLNHLLVDLGASAGTLLLARSLTEALEAVAARAPTVAVVDLFLPDSAGVDTVRQIRARAPDLPLVVVSAAADIETAVHSLQEGADDYLVKGDFDAHSLDRAVRHAAERRRLWTDARRKTLELQRAERRLRSVIEANTDGMLIVDAAGRVRFCNESARSLFGLDGATLEGLHLGIPVMMGTEPVEVEGPELLGRRPRLELRARPVDWEGVPAHLVVLRDVTTQRLLEERVRQAQKMEALGKLTGGIAHDFNNVLAVILNGTEALAELLPSDLPEARAELKEIDVSARRAAGMIRRLLGFSRRGYLRFESLDLRGFTQDATELMRRMLGDRIHIRAEVQEGEAEVRADPAALQQIFLNVTANARDAMPEGGTLTVRAGQVTLDETHRARYPWVMPGVYERVSISDTGVGMTDDVLQRVFEPFFTTKGPQAGTGLGMAMVYGLMKQHRALVHVQSKAGQGTTVDLFFPSARKEHRTAPLRTTATAAPPGPSGTETLLVIEDEPALRRAMQRILGNAGYRILLAADGREGLERFRAHAKEVDLVLSDLVMPQLGGREVVAGLRAAGSSIPVLLVTGYGAEYMDEIQDEGVSMLTKPWSRESLLRAVRAALGGPGARPDAAGIA